MTKAELNKNGCNNFRFIRNQLGLNQSQMAEKLLLKRETIASIEEHRSITLHHVYLLSKFVNVSMETLVETDMKKQNQDILNPG